MREPREIYTIITTSVNIDQGYFQDPTPAGSFYSFKRANAELLRLIEKEKETLDPSLYDMEEQSDDVWYVYKAGYDAAYFIRIEIIPSQLMDEGEHDG